MSSLLWTGKTPIHFQIFAGILARAKGMAVEGGGALLLAFIAYNVALGVFAWCMYCFPLVLRAQLMHRVKMIVCPLTGTCRTHADMNPEPTLTQFRTCTRTKPQVP